MDWLRKTLLFKNKNARGREHGNNQSGDTADQQGNVHALLQPFLGNILRKPKEQGKPRADMAVPKNCASIFVDA
jgi:hypothetical protein